MTTRKIRKLKNGKTYILWRGKKKFVPAEITQKQLAQFIRILEKKKKLKKPNKKQNNSGVRQTANPKIYNYFPNTGVPAGPVPFVPQAVRDADFLNQTEINKVKKERDDINNKYRGLLQRMGYHDPSAPDLDNLFDAVKPPKRLPINPVDNPHLQGVHPDAVANFIERQSDIGAEPELQPEAEKEKVKVAVRGSDIAPVASLAIAGSDPSDEQLKAMFFHPKYGIPHSKVKQIQDDMFNETLEEYNQNRSDLISTRESAKKAKEEAEKLKQQTEQTQAERDALKAKELERLRKKYDAEFSRAKNRSLKFLTGQEKDAKKSSVLNDAQTEYKKRLEAYNKQHPDQDKYKPLTRPNLATLRATDLMTDWWKTHDDTVRDILLGDEEFGPIADEIRGTIKPVAGSENPSGKGKEGDGLFDDQIRTVMKKVPDFLGVWARDEIPKLIPKIHPNTRIGWIMNTDKHDQPGSHWVAILADGRKNGSHSIEYFDPLADEMHPDVQHALKQVADKIDPNMMMKLKTNHVKHQYDSTDTCGYHAMNFLIDRIQRNKTFPEASGFSDRIENKAGKYEHDIEELKKVPPFSYINYQHGTGVVDKVKEYGSRFIEAIKGPRSGAPPEVRNFIASHPQGKITDIKVHREPISAGITKVGNLITGGKLDQAKKELKYDNLFHLYMTFKVDGKPMLLEKNEVVRLKSGGRNGGETVSVSTPAGLTVEKFFEKGTKRMGNRFWSYDVANNNCQDFISSILSANGINNSSTNSFIKQDAKAIIKKLPKFAHKFANVLTNLASRVDIIRNGKGRSLLDQFRNIKARLEELRKK